MEYKDKKYTYLGGLVHGITGNGYENQHQGLLPQESDRAISREPEGTEDVRPIPRNTEHAPQ